MKLFIYEHLSAAGCHDPSLAEEGAAMLRAALRDFSWVVNIEPFGMSKNFPLLGKEGAPTKEVGEVRTCKTIRIEQPWRETFYMGLEAADAALIIAPETGGTLHDLTEAAEKAGKKNFGSGAGAVLSVGNKLAFARLMKHAGIAHPATWVTGAWPRRLDGRWVMKPVDGVGCEGIITGRGEVSPPPGAGFVLQEFIEGAPMSVSVVSCGSVSRVLSVNRQFLSAEMKYTGGEILPDEPDGGLTTLVDKVRNVIPGLAGYWGMDFVMTDRGPVVIEVNPRLTTSYCALAAALDINPALAIASCAGVGTMPEIRKRRRVKFSSSGGVTVV